MEMGETRGTGTARGGSLSSYWTGVGGSSRAKRLRACLVFTGVSKIPVTSNVWTHAWSIKYRLITNLIAQLATNL